MCEITQLKRGKKDKIFNDGHIRTLKDKLLARNVKQGTIVIPLRITILSSNIFPTLVRKVTIV